MGRWNPYKVFVRYSGMRSTLADSDSKKLNSLSGSGPVMQKKFDRTDGFVL
jgi:hypothetical protein